MAENKKSSGSFLTTAAAVGTAGGLGYASYRLGKSGESATSSFMEVSQSVQTQKKPLGFNSRAEYLNFMREHAEFMRTPEGAELAKQAWIEAASNVAPSSKDLLDFTGSLNSATGTDVYQAIEETLTRNESKYIGRVAFQFKRNMAALQRHYAATGTLPKFASASSKTATLGVRSSNLSIDELPKGIRGYVSRIQQQLGGSVRVKYSSRPGWQERKLGQYSLMFDTPQGQFNVNLPRQVGGLIAEGTTQSSMRIAKSTLLMNRATGEKIGTLSAPHFMLHQIENTVVPAIKANKFRSGRQIQSAINTIYANTIGTLESVPNVPGNLTGQGLQSYTSIKGKQVQVRMFDPTNTSSLYQIPTIDERRAILKSNQGLFPFTSPGNLSEAVYSKYNPRGLLPTPEAMDFSRQPRQLNRQWKASARSVRESMKTPWAILETQQWRQDMGHHGAPMFSALYVDPEAHPELLEKWGMAEGEHLFSNAKSVRRRLEFTTTQYPKNLKSIAEGLEERISSGAVFKPGEILGYDTTGKAVKYRKTMQLTGLTRQKTGGKGDFFQLAYDETVKMGKVGKTFGIKGMGKVVDIFSMQSTVAQLTKNANLTNGMEMIISMDILKKDRQLHNQQLIGALWQMLEKQNKNGIKLSGVAQSFHQNPIDIANSISARLSGGTTYNESTHQAFVSELMGIAKESKVSAKQFGAIFGSVPYTMGQGWAGQQVEKLGLGVQYSQAMYQGFSGGVGQAIFNGPIGRASGGLGSLEPRVFEQLTAGHFGATGNRVAEDLFSRLAQTNPEQFEAHQSLTKSLQSMAGEIKPGKGDTILDLSDINKPYRGKAFQEQIEKGGFWMRTGGGIPDVYVPGADEGARLSQFKTASGEVYKGDVAKLYHNYAKVASTASLPVGGATGEEVQKAFNQLVSGVQKQQAPLGKGAGRLFGGEVSGSRYLEALSSYGDYTASNYKTIGIAEGPLMRMVDEMKTSGLYDEEAVARMRETLRSGGSIPGMTLRHPNIGQYSQQFNNIEMIRGVNEPIMVLPSKEVGIGIAGEAELNPIKLGPMVGHAGDYDGDNVAAFLLNPKLNKDIEAGFTSLSSNPEYEKAHIQHQIRKQLIKAKSIGERGEAGMTMMDKMVADAEKLGVTESWTGKLSNEISNLKMALPRNMPAQRAANVRDLLEFVEQVPVAGKKLSSADVYNKRMESLFETFGSALSNRDAPTLQNTIEQMLSASGETTRRLLTQDIKLSNTGAIRDYTGVDIGDTIKGLNIQQTTEDLMEAARQADASGASNLISQMRGQAPVRSQGLPNYLANAAEFLSAKTGGSSIRNVVSSTLTGMNKLMAAGKGILTNKKVGFGFAGAVGLAMALSSPKDSIGPSSALNTGGPNMNPQKASRSLTPDQIVESQPLGNPTVNPQISPTRALIEEAGDSATMMVRVQSDGRFNSRMLTNSSRLNSSINVNIRDKSDKLNKHLLINKLLG